MQPLRSARFLARLVLAWFALVVGTAAAMPLLHPQAGGLQLICSGGGLQLVAAGDEEGQPPAGATLDCPLCAVVAPPPPAVTVESSPPLARLLQSIPAARLAALAAPALPARGPPSRFA